MGKFVVQRGNVKIEVESGIDEMLERLIRDAAPRTIAALERELDAIVANAKANWPVGRERGRPHSRDLFEITFRFDPGDFSVEATIYNRAVGDYAYKIKTVTGVSPWQEYVVKKVNEAEYRLAEILAEELAAVIDGR